MAEIKFEEGIFYIGDKQNPDAELTFSYQDSHTIIADHTFVHENLRGEGIAGQLFTKLITFARKEGLQIIPQCSYIRTKMERTSAYDDVLKK